MAAGVKTFFFLYYAASFFVVAVSAATADDEVAFVVVRVRSSAAVAKSPTCLHSSADDGSEEGESFQLTTGDCNDGHNDFTIRRRSFLDATSSLTGIIACTSSSTSSSNRAHAYPVDSAILDINRTTDISGENFFDCLLDLPPVTQGCSRLYLCRHGETESNRLKIIRGTNSVDEPINSKGIEQATRLGIALARLTVSRRNRILHAPALVTYSNFLRAKETAKVLTSTANSILKQQQQQQQQQSQIKFYGVMSSLDKVDFGSGLEGEDFNGAKSKMMSTIASWARGDIDQRTDGKGESGREVLKRAVHTLESLGKVALSSSPLHGQSILAVSHSTYIRVLLSLAENVSLVESFSSSWKIDNGSVSIIDINTDGKQRVVSAESGIFDTGLKVLGSANNDLVLVMPECHLIRRNEVRHLAGMSKVGNNIIH